MPASTDPARAGLDTLARAWHALSDHAHDGAPYGGPSCNCESLAPRLSTMLAWFTGDQPTEPDGLGAVVTNPVTGKVYVRASHPNLPWYDPESVAHEQWADPTCEDWYMWDALPRPLTVQSEGWAPPPRAAASTPPAEPTGLGAVVTDAAGHTLIRTETSSQRPWLEPDPRNQGVELVAEWDDLAHPVTVRSLGWVR